MPFPHIDPVLFSFGFIVIRWYALAYVAGLIIGWRWCMAMAKTHRHGIGPELYDEFLSWAVLGVLLGGRLFYILFYNLGEYLAHPLEIVKLWHGGMSFHGGMIGVIIAACVFARRKKISVLAFTDPIACVAPVGLGLGRCANFINGELFGRPTDVPWAIIFPRGGDVPRHPSQLYEALAEGLVLLIIMVVMSRSVKVRACTGILSGTFLLLYGAFRFIIEFFREPDPQLGFLFAGATMGQMLCVPMVVAGIAVLIYSVRQGKKKHEGA